MKSSFKDISSYFICFKTIRINSIKKYFKISKIIGKEKKIDECGALFDTSNCNHDQDVILQCFGGDGDTTGNAAIISAMAKRLPPKLGKLPLAPIIDLKCETTLNE
jgi:hypothetical protein